MNCNVWTLDYMCKVHNSSVVLYQTRLLIFVGLQKRLRQNRNLFRLFSFWQWILFIGFNELMEEKKVVRVPFERGGMSSLDDRLAWVASNRPPDNLQYSGSIGTSTGWNVFMFPILLYSIIENTTAIAPTFLWRMFIGFCLFVTRKKKKKSLCIWHIHQCVVLHWWMCLLTHCILATSTNTLCFRHKWWRRQVYKFYGGQIREMPYLGK